MRGKNSNIISFLLSRGIFTPPKLDKSICQDKMLVNRIHLLHTFTSVSFSFCLIFAPSQNFIYFSIISKWTVDSNLKWILLCDKASPTIKCNFAKNAIESVLRFYFEKVRFLKRKNTRRITIYTILLSWNLVCCSYKTEQQQINNWST